MFRSFLLLFAGAVCVAQPQSQPGALDPVFDKFPFAQWLREADKTRFRWTLSVPRAELSFHQRLLAHVEVQLDGRDLETRRGDGEMVFLVQITDHGGTRYQAHGIVDLGKLDENIKAANLEYSQDIFVLPGDYRLAVALVDTATGEHSTRDAQFRVAPQHGLLAEAWRGLPPVEFIGAKDSPDNFFLPEIQGRLQWATSVHSPARLNVILNVAPSVPMPRSRRPQSGELAALIPTLKALSQTGSSSVLTHVKLLDLSRRRAVFDENKVHDLDWSRLKSSFGEATTATIDIHSLSERHHDAQFFVSQVRSLLKASDSRCVLVVLAKPVAFDSGEDLEPISTEGLQACHVFYIRYHTRMQPTNPFGRQMGRRGRGPGMGGPMNPNRLTHDVVDQLEKTLKPLDPRVFDIEKPEQITKALAEIEQALSSTNL